MISKINATLYLLCSWDPPQLFWGMAEAHNETFIAQGCFVWTIYLHGHVWMIGSIDAPLDVIRAQMLLRAVTNNALVVTSIHFIPIPVPDPDAVLRWYLFFGICEIDQLSVPFLER